MKGSILDLKLLRGHQKEDRITTAEEPVCRFVNVQLCGAADLKGTVLLENPHGTSVITLDQLKRQVLRLPFTSLVLELSHGIFNNSSVPRIKANYQSHQ